MRGVVIGTVFAVLAAAGFWFVLGQGTTENASAAPVDIAEGKALYAENCASCHGAELEGQPDWRSPGPDGRLPAPPHDETGHTWHHPDSVLFDYTKLGGEALMAQRGMEFGSGMPGFGDSLTDQQIRNILGYIRSTWPEDVKQAQAERTKADNGAN
ncbi:MULTISPECIES: c-type cytochrome [Rhodobacterales]|uniref:Cytochrome c, mono-and diheme variants n=1 Tax=Roseivivax sediminis TaxID=936889 RepID=A0A1I1WPK6_9RHOB|nr:MULTISPECIES: cytochrome c [Rhodobacterales]MCA1334915.1 cytochrome c [Pseudooceanicola marinus]SFD97002.1 Cytochrome c, mono-and diheme variants [Roseivivax sediminis]